MSDLAAHLSYFRDLGVTGVSRDPAWRRRAADAPVPAPPTATGAEADHAASGSARDAARLLSVLKDEIGPACPRCKLCGLGRTTVVFGSGSPKARLMFVGEAPGEDEDRQGLPFVGRAGQLLTKIIEAIGLTREQVYIANVIKCRPPENRNPEPDEVAACSPFLFRQVELVAPRVIVALGKFSAQCLLQTTDPITRLRGRAFEFHGRTLIPTFHPAYLLRNPAAKREVWEDMKKVRALLQADGRC